MIRVLVIIGIVVTVAVPTAHRWLWRWGERSQVGSAVATLQAHGCFACHPRSADGFRWRGDGAPVESSQAIRDALQRGRPAVPGMPGPMPAFGARVSGGTVGRLVLGTEIAAGLVEVSDESEIRIGMAIATEMGCFDCHGPMGSGGVRNPGTLGGQVPGFFGASFDRQVETMDGIKGIVRDGRTARRAWWMPWKRPALDMPAYGDRLDSIEIALLAYAVRSLNEDPPTQ